MVSALLIISDNRLSCLWKAHTQEFIPEQTSETAGLIREKVL